MNKNECSGCYSAFFDSNPNCSSCFEHVADRRCDINVSITCNVLQVAERDCIPYAEIIDEG